MTRRTWRPARAQEKGTDGAVGPGPHAGHEALCSEGLYDGRVLDGGCLSRFGSWTQRRSRSDALCHARTEVMACSERKRRGSAATPAARCCGKRHATAPELGTAPHRDRYAWSPISKIPVGRAVPIQVLWRDVSHEHRPAGVAALPLRFRLGRQAITSDRACRAHPRTGFGRWCPAPNPTSNRPASRTRPS